MVAMVSPKVATSIATSHPITAMATRPSDRPEPAMSSPAVSSDETFHSELREALGVELRRPWERGC